MTDVHRHMTGVIEFCEYLKAQGIAASVLPKDSPEQEYTGFFSQGPCIQVESRNVAQIRLRMTGVVGPSQLLGSGAFTFSVGPLPVVSRQSWPIQYDYLVRKNPGAQESAYETELGIRTRGFLKKEVLGVEWKGGSRLAKALAADGAIMAAVRSSIRPNEALRVMMNYSLFQKDFMKFSRDFPSPELLDAIERMAEHVLRLS